LSRKTGFLTAVAAAVLVAGSNELQSAQPDRHPVVLPHRPAIESLHTHQERSGYEPPENNVIVAGGLGALLAARRRGQQRRWRLPPQIRVIRFKRPTGALLFAGYVRL
jgi:hypothetical protein